MSRRLRFRPPGLKPSTKIGTLGPYRGRLGLGWVLARYGDVYFDNCVAGTEGGKLLLAGTRRATRSTSHGIDSQRSAAS